MRRFVTLAILFLFTIPFGISISGCAKKTVTVYCNGGDSGVPVGQVTTVVLQPRITGISLNFGVIGQSGNPTATDCKGSSVSATSYTYGTTDMTIADIQPTTGRLCAGTWNRNSGAGVADYTTCIPTNKSGTAFITASTGGATSNPVPVFVHPIVTSVVLGPASTNCATDPATNCSPAASTSTTLNIGCTVLSNGCCTQPIINNVPAYTQNSCSSQSFTTQLAARIYQGTDPTVPANNISCLVGHLTYAPQVPAILTVDENGVATAQAPGSTVITSNLANAGSSAGFFSTCPPATIQLTIPQVGGSTIAVNQNNPQPLTTTVLDTNGNPLTGLTLEYVSTTPTTIPVSSAGVVTPAFPGTAEVTAQCQPASCNPAPFNSIGQLGNGKPITSNPITITTPGTGSTQLFIASTQSQYMVPIDFTTTTLGAPVRLPYVPNSMVISNDGASVYMGNALELMVINAANNSVAAEYPTLAGTVLAVSPDSSTVVISDPVRQFIYLASSTGTVTAQTGGVGTRAAFSPDSQTVYITAGSQLLVHSNFTGWYTINGSALPVPPTDVTATVPGLGAFFSGTTTTARGYCPATTISTSNGVQSVTNVFYPDAGVVAPATDRVTATTDGVHILGATVTPSPTFTDLHVVSLNAANPAPSPLAGACPQNGSGLTFTVTPALTSVLSGVTATAITGVDVTTDSTTAFVTYTGTGGVLPRYTPTVNGPGTLTNIPLSGTATAPVAGVFSTDNTTFYVGTSGDNLVHVITKGATGFADTTTPIVPNLPNINGGTVVATPNLIVQKPRKTTS